MAHMMSALQWRSGNGIPSLANRTEFGHEEPHTHTHTNNPHTTHTHSTHTHTHTRTHTPHTLPHSHTHTLTHTHTHTHTRHDEAPQMKLCPVKYGVMSCGVTG